MRAGCPAQIEDYSDRLLAHHLSGLGWSLKAGHHDTARVLQEVRQLRFEELYERRQQRILTMAEAGEMLGVTERTFRHWSGRYDTEGVEGLQDRRLGRPSGRAVPVDEALRMVTWYDKILFFQKIGFLGLCPFF